jgi:hypothetical protein
MFSSSFSLSQETARSLSVILKQKTLSHHHRQGREILVHFPIWEGPLFNFISQSVCWFQITPILGKVKVYYSSGKNKSRISLPVIAGNTAIKHDLRRTRFSGLISPEDECEL